MKYYKTNNEVRAIGEAGDIDGDQSFLVQSTWKLMTAEEVDAHINPPKTEEQILAEKIAEAQKYLVDTAWYIERFNDPSSGKAVPQEILDGRAQARVTINELEVV